MHARRKRTLFLVLRACVENLKLGLTRGPRKPILPCFYGPSVMIIIHKELITFFPYSVNVWIVLNSGTQKKEERRKVIWILFSPPELRTRENTQRERVLEFYRLLGFYGRNAPLFSKENRSVFGLLPGSAARAINYVFEFFGRKLWMEWMVSDSSQLTCAWA